MKTRKEKPKRKLKNILFCMGCLVCCLATPLQAHPINMKAIAQIESSNNPKAVSYVGAKYGRGTYQISEICLKDFNEMTNASYLPSELFDSEINYEISIWYFNVRIPQLLRHFGHPVTVDNVVWAYSAGIGSVNKGIMPLETINYLSKYRRL